jgi:structural maintenance of chromosome 4
MESMLFVFGKRAKKMRLNKLNELIHNSTTMNNLKFARVTIYFKEIRDLEDEKEEDIPNSSFILSREVYKNSSSKYLLDNKEIHFDNLCSILDKKGIDLKHNRFLILQGEVEQISMMKPRGTSKDEIGLLEFLEDIIGTSRYVNLINNFSTNIEDLGEMKQRKANKLKILKNDLNELEDIKNTATDYFKKEKQLFFFLNIDNNLKLFLLNKKTQEKYDLINEMKKKLEEYEQKRKKKYSDHSKIIQEGKEIKQKLIQIDEQIKIKNEKINEFDEADGRNRNEIEVLSKKIEKVKLQLEKSNKNLTTQSEGITIANRDLPKKEKEIVTINENYNILNKEISAKEKEIFEKTQKLQLKKRDIENELRPYDEKILQNNFEKEKNTETIKLLSENNNKVTMEITQIKGNLEALTNNIDQRKKFFDDLNNKQKEIIDILTKSDIDIKKILKTEEEKTENFKKLQDKLSDIKLNNQNKIERGFLLDNLMKAQASGKLKGIYGRLGDLGSIDSKYDIAISTACSNLHNILVEKVDHALQAIEYLRANNLGRATFIILEKQYYLESKMNSFNEVPDAKRLFDLIKVPNKQLLPAFYYAMKDTLVANDLEIAKKYGYNKSYRHRVVTLNGEIIETSGTMSGGGKPKRGAMSNKVQEDDISQEYIDKLKIESDNMIQELKVIKNERMGLENRKNNFYTNNQEIIIRKNALEVEIGNLEKELSNQEIKLKGYKKELNKSENQQEEIKKLISVNEEIDSNNEKIINKSSDIRKQLTKVDEEINRISGEDFIKKSAEIKKLKLRKDEIEKEIDNFKNLINDSPKIIAKCKEEIEYRNKQIIDFEKEIEKNKNEMVEFEKLAQIVCDEIDVLNKEKDDSDTQNKKLLEEIKLIKIDLDKMNEEKIKIVKELDEIKIEIQRYKKDEEKAIENINKNKLKYKNFITEYGFIDEIDIELQEMNKNNNNKVEDNSENNSQMDINNNDNDNENENDNVKIPKKNSKYRKYLEPIYMDQNFKNEEFEDLLRFEVI